MSFNGFDLAAEFDYTLEAGASRLVQNIQYHGKVSLPALLWFVGYFLSVSGVRLTRRICDVVS